MGLGRSSVLRLGSHPAEASSSGRTDGGYDNFFSNTSYPFLMTVDFLLPKTGQLLDFYKMNNVSSLRSERVFSFLD